MTDADLLNLIKETRKMCDSLARNVATHSADHGGHGVTECTEGASRITPALISLSHMFSCAAAELAIDLADAVRELLQDLSDALDKQEGDDND